MMNTTKTIIAAWITCWGALTLGGQTVIQDGFDLGSFSSSWALTSGVTVTSGGAASNTTHYARLAAYTAGSGRELGARFDLPPSGGATAFTVDWYLRVQSTTERQFNLHISTSSGSVGSGDPAINVRYDAAGWAAYDGSAWRTIAGLGSLTPGQWHRVRLTGEGWGQPGARYALAVSGAGGTDFASSATNISWYHKGTPATDPARYFVFTSVYGNGPGFDVDQVTAAITGVTPPEPDAIVKISGTYPHLAVFSGEGEIGIGAVVPWADKLWFVTYPPHFPQGSADRLWMVDSNLTLTAHPQSVGGTHANRLVHRESNQLIIGPHFIDTEGGVRTISPSVLFGRLTATARHLTDPAHRVYFFSMEKGLYDVNVDTLEVTTIYRDPQNSSSTAPLAPHPGAHGKGGYSGQGRLVYANNGESGWSVTKDPGFNGPAGVLTEHEGTNWAGPWNIVERKTFTEVTGPGGIYGNTNLNDPVWSLGWDKRSVLLKTLEAGAWHTWRLPKGSFTHDSLHGWYTEWPRIREIKDGVRLAHMHGLFYRFPGTFSATTPGGLEPICTYLKMPVDYCWWNGQLVIARDDSSPTGGNNWAGQANSALWFGQLADLEQWGAPAGFGSPWHQDAVTSGIPSDPFLVAGFRQRVLHLRHGSANPVAFKVEYLPPDAGSWHGLTNLTVAPEGYVWQLLPATLPASWVRLTTDRDAPNVSAAFILANPPTPAESGPFAGIADIGTSRAVSEGIIRAQSGNARVLQFAATIVDAAGVSREAYYEIGGAMQLRRATNATAESTLRTTYSLAKAGFTVDAASVIYTEGTNRFRLPKSRLEYDQPLASGWPRGVREVVTERNLFNAHGTFYELPRVDAGGFRRVRPVATHSKQISDFASWRGLFVVAGVPAQAQSDGHVFRSDDGQAALWFGNVDDLWKLGAPAGVGGPWKDTAVTANTPSDPYLMLGYQHKVMELSHQGGEEVLFTVEVDFLANNTWSVYARIPVPPGQVLKHAFPAGYSAHWVRLKTAVDTTATAKFIYSPMRPRIERASRGTDGTLHLALSGTTGQPYTVRASSATEEPLEQWTALGNGLFADPVATFEDHDSTNLPRRFYVISTP